MVNFTVILLQVLFVIVFLTNAVLTAPANKVESEDIFAKKMFDDISFEEIDGPIEPDDYNTY